MGDKVKKYDKSMMATARVWSEESYCVRSKVGSVLSKDGRVVSIGYNGTISGAENCCEETTYDEKRICPECKNDSFWETDSFGLKNGRHCAKCDSKYEIEDLDIKKIPRLVSKNTVVHAEANALMFAAKNGIKTRGCTLYVTLSPCIECSKLIIQAGIKRVVYDEEYRLNNGINFLIENGIKVTKIGD